MIVIDLKHNIMTQPTQIRFFIFKDGRISSLPQVPDEKEREIEKIILSIEPILKIFQYCKFRPYHRAVIVPVEEIYGLSCVCIVNKEVFYKFFLAFIETTFAGSVPTFFYKIIPGIDFVFDDQPNKAFDLLWYVEIPELSVNSTELGETEMIQ